MGDNEEGAPGERPALRRVAAVLDAEFRATSLAVATSWRIRARTSDSSSSSTSAIFRNIAFGCGRILMGAHNAAGFLTDPRRGAIILRRYRSRSNLVRVVRARLQGNREREGGSGAFACVLWETWVCGGEWSGL
jgi:hypothetical protein